MNKKREYIDNNEFEEVIYSYIESSFNDRMLESRLVELLNLLITNISQKYKFKGVEMDDVRQDCLLLVFKKLKRFNTSKGSAFNYFTTIILNEMRFLYSKNKKYNEKLTEFINKLCESGNLDNVPSKN